MRTRLALLAVLWALPATVHAQAASPLLDAAPSVDAGVKPSATTHVETEGSLQVWRARLDGRSWLLARDHGRTRVLPLRATSLPFDVGPRTGDGAQVAFSFSGRSWTYDLRDGVLLDAAADDDLDQPPVNAVSTGGCRTVALSGDNDFGVRVRTFGCADARRAYALRGMGGGLDVGLDRVFSVQNGVHESHDATLVMQRFGRAKPVEVMRLRETLHRTYYCVPAIVAPEVLGARVVWLQRTACGRHVSAYAMPVAGGRIVRLAPSQWPRVLRGVKVPAERAQNCLVVDCDP